ncbi:hypothetical protein IID26_00435 [Patescibacteria group bacterium]|nr:hypothetical protein [Patescibacteria group bacterium]
MNNLYLVIIFIVLTAVSFFAPINVAADSASTFLTVSTFIFAILTGFFIARQNNRYNNIRSTISEFDGNISAIYRSFETLSAKAQEKAGEIIKVHYSKILETGEWNYHFIHKSSTITDLGNLLVDTGGDKNYPSIQNETISNMIASLDSLQLARKRMVSLQIERMPTGEWILVIFLALLLLVSLLLVPSSSAIIDSIMKGIFGALIIQVVILLHELDTLKLFESTLGETSAKDILDIIDGRR